MRAFGVTVDDTPQQHDARSSHAIAVEVDRIPLFLDGVISYFESRKPSDDEKENCRRIVHPRDSAFAQQENVARSRFDPIIHEISSADRIIPCPELMSITELEERLVSCVYISSDDDVHEGLDSTDGRRIQAIATKEKKTVITQETLARRWGIGLKTAE
jgi:hypothetical protein